MSVVVHHVGTFAFLFSSVNAIIESRNTGGAIDRISARESRNRLSTVRQVNCEALCSDVVAFTMASQFYCCRDVPVTICSFICSAAPSKQYIFRNCPCVKKVALP